MKCFKWMAASLCLLLATVAFAATTVTPVTFNSADKPIIVQSSKPEFTLTLQSNPTTGYSWFLGKYNSQLISSVTHQYVAPNSKLMGAPGYEIWTFKLAPTAFNMPQKTKVIMEYARPWEKNSGSKSVFEIYLTR